MGLIGSIRKSIKLREISRSFDADTAVEAITERVIRGETTFQDHPLRKLFALSQLDPLLREVVDRHGVDQHRFDELFTRLMRAGAGQWEGGHYVAASALAFAPTLDFVLTNVDRLPWTTMCALLLEYFERGEVGEVSLELRGPADKNDPLYSLWAHQQEINTRTQPEIPETGTTNKTMASLRQRAERGDVSAQYNLGVSYATGLGVPQDDVEAVSWYRKAADQGHVEAQFQLGVAYVLGQGVPQDYAQGVAWYRKAAEQGLADAQSNLGNAYRNGRGVPQDDAQAVAWYRKAAEQGYAAAQSNLGGMYTNGRGVPQDDAQAMTWYRKAADQGNVAAQANLGYAYATGEGVPQDYVEAHKWRNLAASRASAEDREQFAEARDALAAKMTPAQIAEAQKRASEWHTAFDARQE